MPTKRQARVTLGADKAIAALTFGEGAKLELGAVFHVPVRQEGTKTFYRPIGCKVEITEDQRVEIIKMLGGVPSPTLPKEET